ncbi:expressed unknown protein [Seminavis robusta]|uniref:Uncharacterized protein n=1 Tax=Seminavis robusta TaxID=568900 RepID=A0A9N8EJA0_9STRA|nr:expressed unknown protein [Seminavis robusta]|eukprot:Sro1023_g232461.1  (88) ;mRNA; f:4729-4992
MLGAAALLFRFLCPSSYEGRRSNLYFEIGDKMVLLCIIIIVVGSRAPRFSPGGDVRLDQKDMEREQGRVCVFPFLVQSTDRRSSFAR